MENYTSKYLKQCDFVYSKIIVVKYQDEIAQLLSTYTKKQ